jgi:HAMP domain-containing protein
MFLQLILILVVLIPLLAIVLDSQVGRALASRLEGRTSGQGGDVSMERLAFLEGEVERLAAEVERLDEEGRFLQRLLEERQSDHERGLPPGDDRA